MIEKEFVKQGIKKAKLEEYLEKELRRANYSHMDITKTPTSTHITIYSEKPAVVIGRGGRNIKKVIKAFEEDFGIENPQVDAQELENADLDAAAVAKNIAGWLEKGGHPKRVGNTYTRRVMDAGAVGVQIEISGKLSGSRGRTDKFLEGYVKKCGNTAREYVDYSYEVAVTKPGTLGVKVRIMKDLPEYMKQTMRDERPTAEEIREEAEKEAEAAEEDASEDVDADAEVEDATEAPDEPQSDESEAADDAEDDTEEVVEEPEGDIDYEELSEKTIKDIKSTAEDLEIDYEKLLEAERDNKDRTTLIDWLERRVDN